MKDTKKITTFTILIGITTGELFFSEKVIAYMDNDDTTDIGDIYGLRFGVSRNVVSGLIQKGLKKIEKNSTF